jgi:PilZ domain
MSLIERPRASSRRRTRRVALTVPLEVSGKDVDKSSFKVIATATNLNRHGAMLHLNRDLALNSILVIKNIRGTRTSARVVAQKCVAENHYGYGIEFVEADNVKDFWGIDFCCKSRLW